ncbi:MAG: MEKHLA domain-containing protein [Proteobacteria bacterium]|nr:MEKHLA domain-containing protein [Pseudomonadota bacterium]
MSRARLPSAANAWLAPHVTLLLDSHRRLTGRELLPAGQDATALARQAFEAPFALLSHGLEADPLFNYANLTALDLFELDWPALLALPSRASAEALNQEARARLMQQVLERGYIDDYSGVRIASSGRRFVIEQATVWNVIDGDGRFHGQAASFARWRRLPD